MLYFGADHQGAQTKNNCDAPDFSQHHQQVKCLIYPLQYLNVLFTLRFMCLTQKNATVL